ncbi:MAG: hypothetical protein WD098_05010 [Balneolales bacterium]
MRRSEGEAAGWWLRSLEFMNGRFRSAERWAWSAERWEDHSS